MTETHMSVYDPRLVEEVTEHLRDASDYWPGDSLRLAAIGLLGAVAPHLARIGAARAAQGWEPFGTALERHDGELPDGLLIECSDDTDEGGLPIWERTLPSPGG